MGELRGDLERVMGQRAQKEQRPLGRNSFGIFTQQQAGLCNWSRVSEGENGREDRRAGGLGQMVREL